MPSDPQMQAILDQFAQLNAPPLERVSPENARNLPTIKNAVEEMTAESVAGELSLTNILLSKFHALEGGPV